MMVRKISTRFKVLEKVIQVLHFLFCNSFDVFAPWPRNVAHMDLQSSLLFANGYFHITGAFKSHIRVRPYARTWTCINVFGTSDSKHYIRRSFWHECRHVLHCPTNWWAFLLLLCLWLILFLCFCLSLFLRSGTLDGRRDRPSYHQLIEDPLLRFSGACQETCSDIFVTCQIFAGERPLSLPVQSSHKSFTRRIRYCAEV